MKKQTRQPLSVPLFLQVKLVLMLACIGISAMSAAAQTFTILHAFTNSPDGASPRAGLISSGNTLYGTTIGGGSSGVGMVFRINTDGTCLTNLHSFPVVSGPKLTNSEGAYVGVILVLSGNTLYGASYYGGTSGKGTVFRINTDGTCFTNLHNFTATSGSQSTNSDGSGPSAGLIISGNTLYGTTGGGGSSGVGTVFSLNTDGTCFTNLHSFITSSDGSGSQSGLILSGNTLYGTARTGGFLGVGTVFRINTDGTCFTNLHSFTGIYSSGNSEGGVPEGSLVLSGNTLCGTTASGGGSGVGTVFRINTDGTCFTNLYNFVGPGDGADPVGGLVASGNTLYGTTFMGGSSGKGTVFAVNTDGTGFTNLHSFTATSGTKSINSDGAVPYANLLFSGNNLYGMASAGGSTGNGTLFNFSLPGPQLFITSSRTNAILAWPTNATLFALEFTTNLAPPVVWITNSTVPTVIGGQDVVTNAITGTRKFYRLISQ
jgi:uncharacterized repeat protein (TIGR03803 family)